MTEAAGFDDGLEEVEVLDVAEDGGHVFRREEVGTPHHLMQVALGMQKAELHRGISINDGAV